MIPRAVFYARCSTEEEAQIDALVKQVEECEACIKNMGWLHVDSYVESRSGTSTKGRSEYNRLYDDLESDKFDIIVIKSQDRLMRNVMDWYLFIDRLSRNRKRLYIYLEGKFYTPDDALITGIKAILAEEYSRELSKKINNAHHNRQKNGGAVILTSNTYGYKKLPDKSVAIIEEEAAVKRRMYQLCAAGYGGRTIEIILKNDGVVNRNGKPFTDANIIRMIKNPMNKGTAVMGRTHYDFDSKRTIKVPEEEQYVHEHKIPAIVSEELWELANQQIENRAKANKQDGVYRKNSSPGKYILSGKIVCGLCGDPYYRTVRRRYKDGEKIFEWKCKRYVAVGRNSNSNKSRDQIRRVQLDEVEGCDNIHLKEENLFELLEQIFAESYKPDKERIIKKMVGLLRQVLQEKDYQSEIEREQQKKEKIKMQMSVLIDKLLAGVLTDELYQAKQKELQARLDAAQDKLLKLEKKNASGAVLKERIENIESVLKNGTLFEKASTAGMVEEIEKIVVFPTYLEIVFNMANLLGMEKDVMPDDEVTSMRIDLDNRFNYQEQKKEKREVIVEMMKEKPSITAKEIAAALEVSLSQVQYSINVLKKEGRIQFNGSGGKGRWEILLHCNDGKEVYEKEE